MFLVNIKKTVFMAGQQENKSCLKSFLHQQIAYWTQVTLVFSLRLPYVVIYPRSFAYNELRMILNFHCLKCWHWGKEIKALPLLLLLTNSYCKCYGYLQVILLLPRLFGVGRSNNMYFNWGLGYCMVFWRSGVTIILYNTFKRPKHKSLF